MGGRTRWRGRNAVTEGAIVVVVAAAIGISSEGSPTGVDEIPTIAQCGEERAAHIGGNGEKERGERTSLSNARERKGVNVSVGTSNDVLARAIIVVLQCPHAIPQLLEGDNGPPPMARVNNNQLLEEGMVVSRRTLQSCRHRGSAPPHPAILPHAPSNNMLIVSSLLSLMILPHAPSNNMLIVTSLLSLMPLPSSPSKAVPSNPCPPPPSCPDSAATAPTTQ